MIAGPLVEDRQFVGSLAHIERTGQPASLRLPLLVRGTAAAPLRLIEVGSGMVLAQVEFANSPRLEFRDVEHRLFVTLLALHGSPVRQSLAFLNPLDHSGFAPQGRPRFTGGPCACPAPAPRLLVAPALAS